MLSASSPFTFLLFGASGHLAQLKIYPALYVLALKKRLPREYAIIGFARSEMDDASFRELVKKAIAKDMQNEVNEEVLNTLLQHTYYHQGKYDEETSFRALGERLKTLEEGWSQKAVRLAYLSIPPSVFSSVLHLLCKADIHNDHPFRCIMEKPVGHDAKSFQSLKKTLLSCFQEEEIYLLDHYLGKEAVRNAYYLRLANPVLETLLDASLIEHVEIAADETAGLEGRAGYFNDIGTLRDMVQSHLLEIMALLTQPLDELSIPAARLKALKQITLPATKDLNDVILQGQYAAGTNGGKRMIAYREEKDVPNDSRTNTFIALKLRSKAPAWKNVPFYVRSGKRLEKKETRISIAFKEQRKVAKGCNPNRLDIILQGEAGMRLHLQTKLGGLEPSFRPLIMEDPLVCIGDCLPEHANLLLEAINGRKEWFLTFDEVAAAWKLIDPLQAHLEKPETEITMYPAGSIPQKAAEWIARDGHTWFA